MIGKKLFSADKWVGRYFHLREAMIQEALRKESIDVVNAPYPMNRVWIRIRWENRSKVDVKLAKAFLKVYLNDAPLRVIQWDQKEILPHYPIDFSIRKEISIYGYKYYSLPKNEDGFLDIFVNIPPYIDIDKVIRIVILGYLTFNSCFGHFDKQVKYDLRVIPEDWK